MTLTAEDRIRIYLSQTGRKRLSNRQSRRIIQKRLRDHGRRTTGSQPPAVDRG